VPSSVAARVLCKTTLSRHHQRRSQPWVTALRRAAGVPRGLGAVRAVRRSGAMRGSSAPQRQRSRHRRVTQQKACGRPPRVSVDASVTSQHKASPSGVAPAAAISRIDVGGRCACEPLLRDDLALRSDSFASNTHPGVLEGSRGVWLCGRADRYGDRKHGGHLKRRLHCRRGHVRRICLGRRARAAAAAAAKMRSHGRAVPASHAARGGAEPGCSVRPRLRAEHGWGLAQRVL